MDIYTYLKKDHRKVSDLMEQLVSAKSASRREECFKLIKHELTLHAETEQATFYNALANSSATAERIEHAEDEHEEIRHYLSRLSRMVFGTENWMEMFNQLKHAVEHHVKEEESEIFEQAKDILSDEEALQLAATMQELKQKSQLKVA